MLEVALQPSVVSTRRPSPSTQSTALIERPIFSDAGFGDENGDDSSADDFANVPPRDRDEVHSEQTDPERRLAGKAHVDDAATGRYDLGSLDDFDDVNADLPSAHISEFDVSDLDGDIESHGAPTAIMQLPPSMMVHREAVADAADDANVTDVPLRRWSAGPPGPKVAPPEQDELDGGDHMAATLPALSLEAVRAAAVSAGVDGWPLARPDDQQVSLPLPLAPSPSLAKPASTPPAPIRPPATTADFSRRDALRTALDDALAAVTAAQACADAWRVPAGLDGHLDRAVELLSRAIDIADEHG